MMEILRYSVGSVAWGFIIGLICITLFFVMIKGWWKNAQFGCSSYLIGLVLGIILIYQCILICGSVAIIKVSNYSEPTLTELVKQYSDNAEKVLTPEELPHAVITETEELYGMVYFSESFVELWTYHTFRYPCH